ncbi:Chitinase 4 [Sporothrix curviconia]|uniref:chitinase n=1 Tax=Sporothrix curviconia TaxID=1260050 RepID=A0ABP0C772_9PEZI
MSYSFAPFNPDIPPQRPLPTLTTPHGYRSVLYFANWSIYDRGHRPQDIPADQVTHILYAFANIRPETGEVILVDTWADTDIRWKDDSWNEPGNNMYGCMKQLHLLKLKNRNLKVLLSIGGYTNSPNFAAPMAWPQGRACFAETAVNHVMKLGFDGIDIDWEYPQNAAEAASYVALLAEVRRALDFYGQQVRYHFELTVACPAGPDNFQKLDVPAMDRYLDFWNLMSYDYAGNWSKVAGHQANIFPHQTNPGIAPFSTTMAVHYFRSRGVPTDKLVLGLPLYGRAFTNTDGPGHPYDGTGPGSYEKGVWDYKALPLQGAQEHYDPNLIAASCYDPAARTFVTYDTVTSTQAKAKFIRDWGLGGAMFWESSGDLTGPPSLVRTMTAALGGPAGLRQQPNCVSFPYSPYDNLRNHFPKFP